MACCVCESRLDTGKGKKMCKKLNGGAFTSGKATLSNFLKETYDLTLEVVGLDKPNCTVCYECCMKLDKILKLENQIKTLKTELTTKFSTIANTLRCSRTPLVTETADVLEGMQTPRHRGQQRYLHQLQASTPKRRKVIVSNVIISSMCYPFIR